jgi:hypothetical protein
MVPDLQQPGSEVALPTKIQKPEYTKGPVSPLLHWYQWYQCTRGTTNTHLANPHQKPTIPEWYQYQRGTFNITSSQDNITLSQKSNKQTGKDPYQQTLKGQPSSRDTRKRCTVTDIGNRQQQQQGDLHRQPAPMVAFESGGKNQPTGQIQAKLVKPAKYSVYQ